MDGVEYDDLRESVNTWLKESFDQMDCNGDQVISRVKLCKTMLKDDLATLLTDALSFVSKQYNMLSELKNGAGALKTELISSQQKVIQLQSELLASKTEQLQTLQTTVKTSVQDTVKAEFVSYSAAVQKTQTQVLTPEHLKTVVKNVVEEEDRSRSLIVFGLPEEADEQLCEKLGEVFQQIGEKPRVEASRLGKKSSGNLGKVRPVKVTLSSSTTVNQILVKARNLRLADNFKTVFISPDRSPEQRVKHRKLVLELKTKSKEEPTKRHFIRGGTICSVIKLAVKS